MNEVAGAGTAGEMGMANRRLLQSVGSYGMFSSANPPGLCRKACYLTAGLFFGGAL